MATKGPIAAAPIAEVPLPKTNAAKSTIDIKTGEIAHEQDLPFDPAALQAKYIQERDRRLARGEGVEQYTLLDGSLAHYLDDPWVEPGFSRDPVEEETEVVIIGGGFGAQVCAVRLIEAGVTDFKIIEKAGDFGGTWYALLDYRQDKIYVLTAIEVLEQVSGCAMRYRILHLHAPARGSRIHADGEVCACQRVT
jgi:cyclohexanone monooxygenase